MKQIDGVGTFIATIIESAVSLTKNGYPQSVLRLVAAKKFISDKPNMEHFGLTEPAWVDWDAEWGAEIVGYFVLFKSADTFTTEGPEKTALLNYEQLILATGWDGTSFEALGDGTLNGKEVLIRVEENTYQDKTSLQVSWIDTKDASPERSLKSLDSDALKTLSSKLKISRPAVKPVAATPKPAAVPAAPKSPATSPAPAGGAKTPATTPTAAPTSPSKTAATPAAKTAPAAPKPAAKATPAPTPPPPVVEETVIPGLPTETDQGGAWEFVNSVKGGTTDQDMTDTWIAACQEVSGGTRPDSTFTPEEWAKVRDIVIRDLDLKVG